jgi:DNA-binding transcriptional LysR family regulator
MSSAPAKGPRTPHFVAFGYAPTCLDAVAGVGRYSRLKPASEQVFEHFYFAIQAALAGVGVVMGPLALVTEEVCSGRLLMPIGSPAVSSRGYFVYAPAASTDAPAMVALRKWLVAAGHATEAALPEYLHG